jgi:histidyl-tRNA synthetase
MNLSNLPPKGTSDWTPEEFAIRKYIFDTWRSVCVRFGYEEYLTPIVESAEIYRAKSGEDVGGKELMTMVDRGGRELAIRPEMTPSVTRMVSRNYNALPKPIRYFSIANFLRNENPQRGRNREFWQLNADIFGSDSVQADIEVLQLALEIMLAFNPPADSFVLNINNRKLIDAVLQNVMGETGESGLRQEIVRVLDKWEKLNEVEIRERLVALGVNDAGIETLNQFMRSVSSEMLLQNLPWLNGNEGLTEIQTIMKSLQALGYAAWINFQPNIIRGFDYYDGMVFEVFDKNPDNNRAMFGGGRYNGLAALFGSESFPAVGFAPGDETTKLFLESWGLLEQVKSQKSKAKIYLPLLDEGLIIQTQKLAQKLRAEDKEVIMGLEVQKFGKAFETGDKLGVNFVAILGTDEAAKGVYMLKDMESGEQTEAKLQ